MRALRAIAYLMAVAALAVTAVAGADAARAPIAGGTKLINSASATYSDPNGKTYTTQSNRIELTVAKVAALVVTPKQKIVDAKLDAYVAGRTVSRTYSILNSSDIPDAYTIRAVGASPARVQSISFVTKSGSIPVTIGSTVSPTVQPGDSMGVQVVLSTTGIKPGVTFAITLRARTTAHASNGLQSDTGQTWALSVAPPKLTGPDGGQISKTVDRVSSVQSTSGATVTFEVVIKNEGGSTAYNLIVTDPVPAGLTAVPGSARVNGKTATASISGRTLTLDWPSLEIGKSIDVSFDAVVSGGDALGQTFVNTAYIAADGTAAKATTPASVFIGTANVVYDGFSGASSPIAGAIVTLLDTTGQPVRLTPGKDSQNPLVTPNGGTYAFDLTAHQIGAIGSRYVLTIAANGYTNRRIQLDIVRGADNVLYDVTATALDGQPLAIPGGFSLTHHSVTLQNVFGLLGNIPLFASHGLNVSKTASTQIAQPGSRVLFTIDATNTYKVPLLNVKVIDMLPPGMIYAPGTSRVNNVPQEPSVAGNTLTWTFARVAANAQETIDYAVVIFPSVAPGTVLTNTVSVKGSSGRGGVTATGTSNASVQIVSGALTMQGVITGRVFLDTMKTGHFAKGDRGIAGVRIFLEDGTAVTTDSQGRFSFAGVRPGMHVLRIDPTTLPAGMHAATDMLMNSPRSTVRLVHGIMDNGVMEDINFAIESGP